uniref:Uncharacterized protein n=1 Tax=Panagrolaimus sp. ES5 TaxID=591445 RepID=A0AC34F6N4_9BILA
MLQHGFAFLGLFLGLLIFGKVASENYGCPPGWHFGSNCGNNNCYRVVSIPPANKPRAIDDNFCARFDKDSMPAIIKCEEENSFIPTLPKYHFLIQRGGLGLGIYVPINVGWSKKNFQNRDGTPIGYTKWGFVSHILGGIREPGPGGPSEKLTVLLTYKRPKGFEYTWHDYPPAAVRHLLCKRPAILEPEKLLPAVERNDVDGTYVCPAGFDVGHVCGGHYCYRVVPVPEANRPRMIDDNFCKVFENEASPAVIRCKEENDLMVTLSDNVDIADTSGFALGLYIPASKPWSQTNFVTYDGSPIEYLNWGIYNSAQGPFKEPNGFLNGYPERIVSYRRFKDEGTYVNTWHDVGAPASPHLLCKSSAKFKPITPKTIKDEFGEYSCPKDWILGNVCGEHHCYKLVPVPASKSARVIDNNYCGEIDKRSIPAIIRCDEENEFLSTPPFAPTAIQMGFALGLYIPQSQPWSVNGFINYDGSKVEYLKWGISYKNKPPLKEPNGFKNSITEKAVMYRMQKNGSGYHKTWHDYAPTVVKKILCKMPATGVGLMSKPPAQDPPPPPTQMPEPIPTKPERKTCAV